MENNIDHGKNGKAKNILLRLQESNNIIKESSKTGILWGIDDFNDNLQEFVQIQTGSFLNNVQCTQSWPFPSNQ